MDIIRENEGKTGALSTKLRAIGELVLKDQRFRPLLFAVIISLTGGAFLAFSRAAVTTLDVETEQGSLSGNVASFADSTASGGNAVRFAGGGWRGSALTWRRVC